MGDKLQLFLSGSGAFFVPVLSFCNFFIVWMSILGSFFFSLFCFGPLCGFSGLFFGLELWLLEVWITLFLCEDLVPVVLGESLRTVILYGSILF